MSQLSRTLALIKPETVHHHFVCQAVLDRILDEGFQVVAARRVLLSKKDAASFYKAHKGRFFHRRLVHHVTSGPVVALMLQKGAAITKWREVLGPTKVYKCVLEDPNSLRGRFGLSDTRNVGHGSDSQENVEHEGEQFFSSEELQSTRSISRTELHKILFSGLESVSEDSSDDSK